MHENWGEGDEGTSILYSSWHACADEEGLILRGKPVADLVVGAAPGLAGLDEAQVSYSKERDFHRGCERGPPCKGRQDGRDDLANQRVDWGKGPDWEGAEGAMGGWAGNMSCGPKMPHTGHTRQQQGRHAALASYHRHDWPFQGRMAVAEGARKPAEPARPRPKASVTRRAGRRVIAWLRWRCRPPCPRPVPPDQSLLLSLDPGQRQQCLPARRARSSRRRQQC